MRRQIGVTVSALPVAGGRLGSGGGTGSGSATDTGEVRSCVDEWIARNSDQNV